MTGRIAIVLVLAFGTHGQLGCTDVLGVDFEDAQVCGSDGQGCPCCDGLVCINGACAACGGPGEACCPGHDCDPGSACFGPADQAETCTTSCGFVGADCCEGTCPAGGVCIDGACEPSQGVPDPCGGADLHFVYVIDESQCGTRREFWADPEAAQACADEQLAAFPAGWTLGPVDTNPCVWVCQYSDPAEPTGASVEVCAFGAEAFEACTSSKCTGCSFTDELPLDCSMP